MDKHRLLILNGEYPLLGLWCGILNSRFLVTMSPNFSEANRMIENHQCDLILLNVRDNGDEELEFLKDLQEKTWRIPVIVIKGIMDASFAIRAVNSGALGLLEIPLEVTELVNIVDGIFKRNQKTKKTPVSVASSENLNALQLDAKKLELVIPEGSVSLTKTEYQIMSCILGSQNQWISRDQLSSRVWPGMKISRNVLDTHFCNIRRRMPALKKYIEARRGFGIRLIDPPDSESPS